MTGAAALNGLPRLRIRRLHPDAPSSDPSPHRPIGAAPALLAWHRESPCLCPIGRTSGPPERPCILHGDKRSIVQNATVRPHKIKASH